jgi:hypothetical protein
LKGPSLSETVTQNIVHVPLCVALPGRHSGSLRALDKIGSIGTNPELLDVYIYIRWGTKSYIGRLLRIRTRTDVLHWEPTAVAMAREKCICVDTATNDEMSRTSTHNTFIKRTYVPCDRARRPRQTRSVDWNGTCGNCLPAPRWPEHWIRDIHNVWRTNNQRTNGGKSCLEWHAGEKEGLAHQDTVRDKLLWVREERTVKQKVTSGILSSCLL